MTLLSGTITALAANSIFYAFQNPTANNGLCVVTNVSVGFRAIAGSNTSTSFIVSMYATRSYTVLETIGIATAPSLKANVMTSARSTQMNARLRISNNGAISNGTGTDDAQPLASAIFTHPGAISNLGLYSVPLFQQAAGTSSSGSTGTGGTSSSGSTVTGGAGGIGTWLHPLVLAPGEGFRLRADTAIVVGNTFVAYVDVEWFEPTSF